MPAESPNQNPSAPVTVRPATAADLDAINGIYNYYVDNSTCTYQESSETAEGRRAWFERHGPQHPVIVAEAAGEVVGWASLSPFHVRSAYRFTAETSVYIHHTWHRRGIGRLLMRELIAQARSLGYHTLIAGIDGEQAASIELHRQLGFEKVAHLQQVGFKFGRWLDVIYLQLMLE